MNEEALNDSHAQFKQGGYNGSIDDYRSLLQTNIEAREDAYKLFTGGGYNGSPGDFVNLLGLETMPDEKKNKTLQPATESNAEDGSSDIATTTETLQSEPPKDWTAKFVEQAKTLPKEQKQQLKEKIEEVDPLDREAINFYSSKGKNYREEKEMFDLYTTLKNERTEVEKRLDAEMNLASGSEASKARIAKLEARKAELDEKVPVLQDRTFGKESRVLRAEFDQYLDKQQKQTENVAKLIGQTAKEKITAVESAVEKDYGLTIEQLTKYEPKDLQDAARVKSYIDQYNAGININKAAATKYEAAQNYYDLKDNKDIRQKYVDNLEAVRGEWNSGWANGKAGEALVASYIGERSKEDAAKEIAYQLGKEQEYSFVVDQWNKAETSGEAWEVFKGDPIEWATTMIANSWSQALPYGINIIPKTVGGGMVAGATAGATFGPLGAAMGARQGAATGFQFGQALTGFAVEYGNAMMDAVRNQVDENGKPKYDINDPDSILLALNDQKVFDEGNEIGFKRGIPIAIMDKISMGLAGRTFGKKVMQYGLRTEKGAALLAEQVVINPTLEGSGEALAQLSSGQGLDGKEIVAEMAPGMFQSVPSMAMNIATDTRNNSNKEIAQRLQSLSFVSNENVSAERMANFAAIQNKKGLITDDELALINKNIGLKREAQDVLSVGDKKVDTPVQTRVMQLLDAQQELSKSDVRKQVYAEELRAIKEELQIVGKTGKLAPVELRANIEVKPQDEVVTEIYKPIIERQVQDRDEVLVELQAARGKIGFPIDEGFFDDIADNTYTTVDKLDANEEITWAEAERAVEDLYRKYKQLTAMKSDENRMFTIDQIQSMQNEIGNDIQNLTTYIENEGQKPKVSAQENVQGEIVIEPITETETTTQEVKDEVVGSGVVDVVDEKVVESRVKRIARSLNVDEQRSQQIADAPTSTEEVVNKVNEKTLNEQKSQNKEKPKKPKPKNPDERVNDVISAKENYNARTKAWRMSEAGKKAYQDIADQAKKEKIEVMFGVGGKILLKNKDGKTVKKRGVERTKTEGPTRKEQAANAVSRGENFELGIYAKVAAAMARTVGGFKESRGLTELAGKGEKKAARKSGLITDKGRDLDDFVLEVAISIYEFDNAGDHEANLLSVAQDILNRHSSVASIEAELIDMAASADAMMADAYGQGVDFNNPAEVVEFMESVSKEDLKEMADQWDMMPDNEKEQIAKEYEEFENAERERESNDAAVVEAEKPRNLKTFAEKLREKANKIEGDGLTKQGGPFSDADVLRLLADAIEAFDDIILAVQDVVSKIRKLPKDQQSEANAALNRVLDENLDGNDLTQAKKAASKKPVNEMMDAAAQEIKGTEKTESSYGERVREQKGINLEEYTAYEQKKVNEAAQKVFDSMDESDHDDFMANYLNSLPGDWLITDAELGVVYTAVMAKIADHYEKLGDMAKQTQALQAKAQLGTGAGKVSSSLSELTAIEELANRLIKEETARKDFLKAVIDGNMTRQEALKKLANELRLTTEEVGEAFDIVAKPPKRATHPGTNREAAKKRIANGKEKLRQVLALGSGIQLQAVPAILEIAGGYIDLGITNIATVKRKVWEEVKELFPGAKKSDLDAIIDGNSVGLQNQIEEKHSVAAKKIAKALDGDYTDPDTVRKNALKSLSGAILSTDPDFVVARGKKERVDAKTRLKKILADKTKAVDIINKALDLARANVNGNPNLSPAQQQAIINQMEDMAASLLELPVNKSQQRAVSGPLSNKALQAEIKRIAEDHYANANDGIKTFAQKLVEDLDIDPAYATSLQKAVEEKLQKAVDDKIKAKQENIDKLLTAIGGDKPIKRYVAKALASGMITDGQFVDAMLVALGHKGMTGTDIAKIKNLLAQMKSLTVGEEVYKELSRYVNDIVLDMDEGTQALVGKWLNEVFFRNILSNALNSAVMNGGVGAIYSTLEQMAILAFNNPRRVRASINHANKMQKAKATPGWESVRAKLNDPYIDLGDTTQYDKQPVKSHTAMGRLAHKTMGQLLNEIQNAPKGRRTHRVTQLVLKMAQHTMLYRPKHLSKKWQQLAFINEAFTMFASAQDILQGAFMEDMNAYLQAQSYLDGVNADRKKAGLSPLTKNERIAETNFMLSVDDVARFQREVKQEAAERIANGVSLPSGWARRAMRHKMQSVAPKDVMDEAIHRAKKALFLHKPETMVGAAIYDWFRSQTGISDTENMRWIVKFILTTTMGLVRLQVVTGEKLYRNIPLIPIAGLAFGEKVRYESGPMGGLKQVRSKATKEDIANRVTANLITSIAISMLAMSVFEYDEDEDEMMLDPDSWIKFHGSGETEQERKMMEYRGITPNSMQIGSDFYVKLPLLGMGLGSVGKIMGEYSDSIRYKEFRKKDSAMAWPELLAVLTQQAMGSEQATWMKVIKQLGSRKDGSEFLAAETLLLDGLESSLSPAQLEAIYAEYQHVNGIQAEKRDGVMDNIIEDIVYADVFMNTDGGGLVDHFGQPIVVKSRTPILNALVTALFFEDTENHVEGSKYYGLTKGQWFPKEYTAFNSREFARYDLSDEDKARISQEMGRETARLIDKRYDRLQSMPMEKRIEFLKELRVAAIGAVKGNLNKMGLVQLPKDQWKKDQIPIPRFLD